MAMKRYSPDLEPYHQMQFSVLPRTPLFEFFFFFFFPLCKRYKQHILSHIDRAGCDWSQKHQLLVFKHRTCCLIYIVSWQDEILFNWDKWMKMFCILVLIISGFLQTSDCLSLHLQHLFSGLQLYSLLYQDILSKWCRHHPKSTMELFSSSCKFTWFVVNCIGWIALII